MNRVTFFTKPDCTLCRRALFVVENVRRTTPCELELIDISEPGQEEWAEADKHDIPDLHLDGEETLRHRVDAATQLGLVGKPA